MIRLATDQAANEIILTGRTYEHRIAIRDLGGCWNKISKAWRMDAEHALWARETLGAIDTDVTVTKAQATTQTQTQGVVTALEPTDFKRLEAYVDTVVEDKATSLVPDMSETVKSSVAEAVEAHTADLVARLDVAEELAKSQRQIVVKTELTEHVVEGTPHPLFETLVKALGAGLNVWIAGPAGAGKSYAASAAAKALGVPFEVQGAMTMAHELTGFVDAGGTYHETPFVRAFRDGGLILLDEIDAGSNEALLALNGALANGLMSLPNGEVTRAHESFKCIGAANTYGNGATAEYVGRVRLDAAFLNRFGARLDWGYDEALERAISGNEDWARRVQKARRNAEKNGLKVMITPRQSQAGAKLLAAGFDADEAAQITYLAGLTPDQRRMIEA